MPKDPIVVMKIGGSVLKDAEGFRRAAEIIKAEKRKKIVVVSAMAGVTDELYTLVEMATNSQRPNVREDVRQAAMKKCREIWSKHLAVLRELDISPRPDQLDEIRIHLDKMIDMIGYAQTTNPILADAVMSQGEKFSAIIMSALVGENVMFTYVPAKELIIMGRRHLNFEWEWEVNANQTKDELVKYAKLIKPDNNNVLVTEGFVGGNIDGQLITLDRNGSDYSAAIIGSLLDEVEEVQFWKDVPGVMTADPKLTTLATPIVRISYDEIIEATRLGAKVLHPDAIAPLFGKNEKKVIIKNVNEPFGFGTQIDKQSFNRTAHGVTMITVTRDLDVFSIHDSIKSIEHLAPTVYLALRKANIEFATVSQGFSDQNFTVITHKQDAARIRIAIGDIVGGNVKFVPHPVVQIAVIGSNMRGKPGVAGKFLSALGKAGVNILTIQQGSSECSMAATINDKDVDKAIVAVHDAFDLIRQY